MRNIENRKLRGRVTGRLHTAVWSPVPCACRIAKLSAELGGRVVLELPRGCVPSRLVNPTVESEAAFFRCVNDKGITRVQPAVVPRYALGARR
jgi:hypothetical protein